MKIKKKKLNKLYQQLGKATASNEYYRDQLAGVADCRSAMKREAGYTQDTSFDIVWSEVLEKAQKYDALQIEKGQPIRIHSHNGSYRRR